MPLFIATGPGPYPSHRELHPAFYGCFDWHSCVEMEWVVIRLLRLFPGDVPLDRARETLGGLLTPRNIATEIAFFNNPNHRSVERPYGWAWLLTLQHELEIWNDEDGARWAAAVRPLADLLCANLIAWLPKLTYPQRMGMHGNTAFSLLRSLDLAERRAGEGEPDLLSAIRTAGFRFFAQDTEYPAQYEPSGADFLSAALSEAELMSRLLDPARFPAWLDAFLPGLAESQPASLFTPAIGGDETDGQIAHLTGLNLSRATSFVRLAEALPAGDVRTPALLDAASRHARVSLPAVTGGDYMVEHWLAAYASLLLGP
ncbi:MAG: DUF2891 domain-containing protein [Chloroflexia bacterium]|nr:DUF2891 domain-containing protein [Chloroflexia bacterium]